MSPVLPFAHSTAVRVAEIAFLLFVVAGIWIAAASLTERDAWGTRWRFVVMAPKRFRMVVAGLLLATGGVLLIVAAHWGHLFG